MASTEARAKWPHYPNHFILQEDYNRASRPNNQQPPSSSKSLSDDIPADSKWWLHPQPKDNSTPFWEPSWETLEMEGYAKIGDISQRKPMDDDDQFIISEIHEKLFPESEPRLIGMNKSEPWWRTTDLNELASFVSEKSINHFDNSDLPRPQISQQSQRFVPDKGLASLHHVSNFIDSVPRSPTSRISPCGSDNALSSTTSDDDENLNELSKAELLEALCHSQTRAREAEKAAQQAYNEKEHVITHFLKQASHLFAYKQWLHILQLETTYLHLKNNNYHLMYTRFPDFVPWVPVGKQPKRVGSKSAKRCKIWKCFGRFILGLTLVGAGLLLGWTLGWLFR